MRITVSCSWNGALLPVILGLAAAATTTPAAAAATASVPVVLGQTVTVNLSATSIPGSLGPGTTLADNHDGTAPVTFTTQSTTVGDEVVSATCGARTLTANVTVVKVDHLQYQSGGAFVDITGTLAVPVAGRLTFKAIPSPGTTFLAGQPVWSAPGATMVDHHDGTATVTFTTPSASVGDQMVSAACGTDTPVQASVTAFSTTIQARRSGSGNAFSSAADVAGGGLSSHQEHNADVLIQLTPPVAGIQISQPLIVGGYSVTGGRNATISIPASGAVTNTQGLIAATYTSSSVVAVNEDPVSATDLTKGVGGTTCVRIQIPAPFAGPASSSVVITQHWDDFSSVSFPLLYNFGRPFPVTFTPAFSEAASNHSAAVTGHSIKFVIPTVDVWEWDDSIRNYSDTVEDPLNLPSGLVSAGLTAEAPSGTYTSNLTIDIDADYDYIVDDYQIEVADYNVSLP